MKHFKLLLATLLAIVGASSMKALEPADLVGNYLWNYKQGNVDQENTVTIAVSGTNLVIEDMFPDPLKATIQEEGGDTYLVIAKGQRGTSSSGYEYEVQGSADGSSGWGEADIKGKIGTDGVITFDCYLRASIVDMPGYTIGLYYPKGSTLTPLSELPSVVELPTGATVKDYQLAYNENSKRKTKAVGVAIVGNDVYVKGFIDYLPEAWVKGTKVDNNWVFPANQYLGKYGNYDCYYFCNGETTFTYDSERPAYKAYDTGVFGKEAGVQTAYYYEPELSEEFDTQAYAVISSDGENMTFYYDKDYLYAKAKEGDKFSHVYLISFPWANYCPAWSDELETIKKIKKVSFNASFKDYQPLDLYRFFDGMNKLTTIEGLKYLDTSKAQHTALMFQNCSSLESLDLSSFNTEGITNGTMASMFYGCEKLKSITFGANFSTADAYDMQYMFGNCIALESLDLSNFNTENVTTMQGMFYGCKALKELDMSNFDTGKVETMSYMFRECKALESLDVSSFSIGNVIQMYDMFFGCSSLKTIYSASDADWSSVEKSSQMFYGCTNLSGKNGSKKFEYNGTADGTYAMVYRGTAYGGYFTSIKEKPEPYAVLSSDGKTLTFYYDNQKGEKTETVYLIPWIETSPGWYESHNTITTATFDESFKDYDGLTTTRNMFNSCEKLETINHLEYLNTENVTDMYQMFWYCGKLTTLDVSNFNTAKVTNMCNMFSECSSLKMLDLGDNFNTAKVTDMSSMFNACTSLETIYCNDDWAEINENPSLKSDMMFYGCTSLKGAIAYEYGSTATDVSMANPSTGYFTARQPYAVLSKDGKTLTFYYDENKAACQTAVGRPNVFAIPWSVQPGWVDHDDITTATFDESFKNYHGLTSTRTMFAELTGLKTINHLEYLNTENVTDMQYMFNGCSSLETIDLSSIDTKKVTNMGAMFYGCYSLKTIDLSNFNTQNVTNMNGMFNACSSLETIYCAEGTDWSGVEDRDYTSMFSDCSMLSGKCGSEEFKFDENFTDGTYARVYTGDDIAGGYFTSITEKPVAYAVRTNNKDDEYQTLTFYYDTDKAKHVSEVGEDNVFDVAWDSGDYDCPKWTDDLAGNSSITTVTFDKSFDDYHGLKNTNSMFTGLFNLTTINGIEYLHTEKVTTMLGMFGSCFSLKTLDVSHFNTEKVTNMLAMFYNCVELTELDLSNFDTKNVTDMTRMFYNCSKLETIYCAEGADWSNVEGRIYENMFSDCSKLSGKCGGEEFKFDENFTDGTYARVYTGDDEVGGYFTSITERQAYAVLTDNETDDYQTLTFYYDASKAAWLEKADRFECTVYDIPWTGTYPGWTKWDGNNTITTVTFDKSFGNYYGLTSTKNMFYNCYALETINDIKYLNTENVTNMYQMFSGCSSLETLDLSHFDTGKVEDMSWMFDLCGSLTSVDVSHFNTSNVTDMSAMFMDCSSLTSVDVSNFVTDKVTNMGGMFGYCSSLETLDLSNFVTDKVTDMGNMFGFCSSLKSLDVSKFVTDNVESMCQMFWDCQALTSLDVSNFNTSNVTDMSYMFRDCKALTSLDLSNFNTSNVTNMSSMFNECSSLTTIYCNNDWKREGEEISSANMFDGCTKLVGANFYSSYYLNDVTNANPNFARGYFTPFYDLTVTEAGMATLYLDYVAAIPDDVEVYFCTGLNDNEAYPTEESTNAHRLFGSIPSRFAVFVIAAPGTYRFAYYSGKTIYIENASDNILTGTLEEINDVEPHSVLTLGYGNKTEKLGFWWYTGTTIPAHRAYIPGEKLSEASGDVKGITIVFDEETRIEEIVNGKSSNCKSDEWYDLSGRKLEGKPTQKGLYINNGRKVLIQR